MMVILLKFIACSAFLLLLFHIFLAKEKTFRLNRWVLLFLIPTAMVIPFISFPVFLPHESPVQISYLQLAQNQSAPGISSSSSQVAISPLFWFLVVYFAVFFLLFLKKLKALLQLIKWTKVSPVRPIQGALLILSDNVLSPFSFGKYIFMHPSAYREGSENTEMILKHERFHIANRHHIDLIWMEFLIVVCWFNPVIYLVKRAMVLNHEYLADQEVQHATHPIKYKKLLLKLTVRNNPATWTSSISASALKNRLIMMNKPTTKNTKHLRVISFCLFASLIIAGFSLKINAQQPAPVSTSSPKQTQLPGDQTTPVEKQPEFKGGMAAFYKYVERELKYPLQARQKGIEGKVEVQFVVEKDGSLSNVTAISGIGAGCDREAERVVRNVPAFNPGRQRGRPVRVQMVLPILFSLNKPDRDSLPSGAISVEEVDQRNGKLKVDAEYANGLWTGTVQDPDGNFLPGATIVVVETSRGSVTDVDGRFSIYTSPSERIVISFVGYEGVRLVGK